MAVQLQLKTRLRPERCDMKFDMDRGTKVEILTNGDGVLRGIVYQNPTKVNGSKYLELHQAVRLTVERDGTKVNQTLGPVLRIEGCDVRKYTILGKIEQPSPPVKKELVVEKLHPTEMVTKASEFEKLIEGLRNVKIVGLNFYGSFVGRDGKVGWISLFLKNRLVCIDAIELPERMRQFWTILNKALFSNPQILKVIYNSRPIADFLYHQESIEMDNVDDLQVADFMVWAAGHPFANFAKDAVGLKYKSLSDLLRIYLGNTIPSREIDLVRDFEKEDFSVDSPSLTRPCNDNKYCKCVAVEMKYLLKLHDVIQERLLDHKNQTVRAQLVELVNGSNDKMEKQLRDPLHIPEGVLQISTKPAGKFADVSTGSGRLFYRPLKNDSGNVSGNSSSSGGNVIRDHKVKLKKKNGFVK